MTATPSSIDAAPTLRPALTDAQAGLWFAQRLDPSNPVFNTGQYLDLSGPLDRVKFAAAVARAMAEADALRVSIVEDADGPHQHLTGPVAALEIVDLQAHADPMAAALAAMQRDMATAVDLGRDPLAAQRLFILGETRHVWYQRVHHVAIDGYGTSLLTRRICDLYAALVTGRLEVTRPFLPYAHLLEADAAYQASAARAADRAFWLAEFADRPEVVGLADGVPLTAHEYRRAAQPLPKAVSQRLTLVADDAGAPWPDVLVAVAGAYLQRHVARSEAVVGVPAMLRVGSAAARVPAMVMNVLPVRVGDADATSFRAFVAATSARLREARKHGRYRGEQLRRDLGLLGEQRRLHGPLVNVLPFDAAPDLLGLTARLEVLGTGPVDDLTITFRADAEGRDLRLELDANPRLYSEADLAAHLNRLATFLEAALSAPDLAAVPIATPAEARRYVVDVNATAHAVPDLTLTGLIEHVMRHQPAAPAVEFEGDTLSYGDLDQRSARLATLLAALGAGRNRVVAVCVPRSLELEIALVGVLRAGAAYLPIDPDTPPERLRTLLASAQPSAVATTRALAPSFPADLRLVVLDEIDWRAPSAVEARLTPPEPRDAAYVIYTSGSTGAPKGVVIEHQAIVNRLEWMREHYGIDAGDRILQKTPATFDVSVWEFFLPLISGGVLVMAPPDAHRDPAWLARLIREQHITTLHFVPSMLAQFLAEPAARALTIRRVFCSGEALSPAVRDRFHDVVDAELHNLYGPTEAAVDVTFWDAGRHDRGSSVPIGRPVWNTRMYVLDAQRRPLPDGVPGDLYIAGTQLARGYLGRPDLTAERFVVDPFGAAGARMYHTGDVAKWRRDGAIEFLGRSDHQVKIRGQRIEPGEIEVALATGPVAQAVVVADTHRGEARLVAYLVPHAGQTIAIDEVATKLRQRVPGYMVPSAFVVLEELPLNSSGKLDRRRLPAPATAAAGAGGPALATATERGLAAIFDMVLERTPADGPLDGDSDFFALGGHSLLATQVMRAVRETWHCDLGLGVLFASPTVAALARAVDGAASRRQQRTLEENGLGVLVKLATGIAPPLFCVHPAGGIAWCYSPLARAMSHDVYGVQALALDVAQPLPATLDAMAADYVTAIRRVQPEGPYHLLGWSVGGIIAHAMAARLEQEGATVGFVALLDAYPADRWRDQAPPDEGAAWNALLLIAGLEPASDVAGPATRASVLQALRASGHPLGSLPDETLEGVLRVVAHNSQLVRAHRHARIEAPLLHFRAALDHQDTALSPSDWAPYVARPVEVQLVPARHPQMVSVDASRRVAAVIEERLTR